MLPLSGIIFLLMRGSLVQLQSCLFLTVHSCCVTYVSLGLSRHAGQCCVSQILLASSLHLFLCFTLSLKATAYFYFIVIFIYIIICLCKYINITYRVHLCYLCLYATLYVALCIYPTSFKFEGDFHHHNLHFCYLADLTNITMCYF